MSLHPLGSRGAFCSRHGEGRASRQRTRDSRPPGPSDALRVSPWVTGSTNCRRSVGRSDPEALWPRG